MKYLNRNIFAIKYKSMFKNRNYEKKKMCRFSHKSTQPKVYDH